MEGKISAVAEPPQSVFATMGSAAKFWPARLFGFGGKSDAHAEFTPTTEIAARIVGKSLNGGLTPSSSFLDSPTPYDAAKATPDELDAANDADMARQAERFVPVKASTVLTDKRGKVLRARIINVSATGVAIEADFRIMPPDSVTMVGSKIVTVGRPIRGGQVFLFDKPLDPARCNPQIVL